MKSGVTLKLLWDEYVDTCRSSKKPPCMLFSNKTKQPQIRSSDDFETMLKKCSNQAWDLSYLSTWSTLYWDELDTNNNYLFATMDTELKKIFVHTHDLEAALFNTGLGQDIYTKELYHNGHYNHLETINRVRQAGSIKTFITENPALDGIIASCIRNNVPMVLAGSIRDDGPLPGVIGYVYDAQDEMRRHITQATTVIALATQLHTIATGNMTPSWQKIDGNLRPVYFYNIDISEFAVSKLRDRGSLSVNSIVTNVQDFLINAARSLAVI